MLKALLLCFFLSLSISSIWIAAQSGNRCPFFGVRSPHHYPWYWWLSFLSGNKLCLVDTCMPLCARPGWGESDKDGWSTVHRSGITWCEDGPVHQPCHNTGVSKPLSGCQTWCSVKILCVFMCSFLNQSLARRMCAHWISQGLGLSWSWRLLSTSAKPGGLKMREGCSLQGWSSGEIGVGKQKSRTHNAGPWMWFVYLPIVSFTVIECVSFL